MGTVPVRFGEWIGRYRCLLPGERHIKIENHQLVIGSHRWRRENLGLPGIRINTMWKKVLLREPNLETVRVVGECNRCLQCCVCWFYEMPDQPACIPPRKGWCPYLELETKACRIWAKRPEGCRNFPTARDFELGCVPQGCGFRLVGKEAGDGKVCQS